MLYIKPDYYEKFSCVGGVCPDTCCAGWQVMIDDEEMDFYETAPGDLGDRIRKSIDYDEGCFLQQEDGRCAFLREDGLCDIYKETQSTDWWTVTCDTYPRHTEEFEGVREISIGMSCPIAAEMILKNREKVTFIQTEDDREDEDYEDFDYLLYTKLTEARPVILSILQNRDLPLETRKEAIHIFTEDLQDSIDLGQLYCMDSAIQKWQDRIPMEELQDYNPKDSHMWRQSYFQIAGDMYPLRKRWTDRFEAARQDLFTVNVDDYYVNYDKIKYDGALNSLTKEEWDIAMEQILVYFVFIYFCGAVYDDNPISKVRMALMSQEIIEAMCVSHMRQHGEMNYDILIDIAHDYCRELEHSEENLNFVMDSLC